ncbi:hypothetical protein B0H11DRAFT_1993456 [Mycena galericulata]|nr:hypothetical protein B0H11DRAFT_1993456 [Mycena galericulata]
MPSFRALPLDDDILDRILTFCATFGTLKASILVSKAFYRVFRSHPKSITRAVAYNVVGPALPQALRVVRYPYNVSYDGPFLDAASMATACPENQDIGVITAAEGKNLEKNSRVVEELEDIYSLKNKDRTSSKSLLTQDESWRFRRAMYRIMMFCNMFTEEPFEGEDIDDTMEGRVEMIRLQRIAVLDEYSTVELHQLYSVVKFMRGIVRTLAIHPREITIDALLSLGPAAGLHAYQHRRRPDYFPIQLFAGYFSRPLHNIWKARNVTPPNDDERASAWIVDAIQGAEDTCSQCGISGGIDLYTEANWSRFPIYFPNLLKARLTHNPAVRGPEFFAATAHLFKSDALGPWIGDMFARRKTPEFDGWARESSYCFACLKHFLTEHLWRWFLEERIKAGWVPPPNCRHGWECLIQDDPRHATAKNHLCVPIIDKDGDGMEFLTNVISAGGS